MYAACVSFGSSLILATNVPLAVAHSALPYPRHASLHRSRRMATPSCVILCLTAISERNVKVSEALCYSHLFTSLAAFYIYFSPDLNDSPTEQLIVDTPAPSPGK